MSGLMGFVRRHKWKLGLVGTGAAAYYLKAYLDERVAEMERQALEEHLSRARREEHFSSNEKNSSEAVEKFLPDFGDEMDATLGLAAIAKEMRDLPRNAASVRDKKIELWKKLAVKTVTGVVAGAYVMALLVVFLRVQVNILGGYAYLSTIPGKEDESTIERSVQRDFLGLVKHLQVDGTREVVAWVEPVVENALAAAGLNEPTVLVNSTDIQKVISDVIGQLSRSQSSDEGNFARFLIPRAFLANGESASRGRGSPSLAYLVKETRDVLDAPTFLTATRACVDQCISHMIEGVSMSLTQMPHDVDVEGPEGKPYRLLKVLKPVKDQSRQLFNAQLGPVQELLVAHTVKTLSKSVYESFSEQNST